MLQLLNEDEDGLGDELDVEPEELGDVDMILFSFLGKNVVTDPCVGSMV